MYGLVLKQDTSERIFVFAVFRLHTLKKHLCVLKNNCVPESVSCILAFDPLQLHKAVDQGDLSSPHSLLPSYSYGLLPFQRYYRETDTIESK